MKNAVKRKFNCNIRFDTSEKEHAKQITIPVPAGVRVELVDACVRVYSKDGARGRISAFLPVTLTMHFSIDRLRYNSVNELSVKHELFFTEHAFSNKNALFKAFLVNMFQVQARKFRFVTNN